MKPPKNFNLATLARELTDVMSSSTINQPSMQHTLSHRGRLLPALSYTLTINLEEGAFDLEQEAFYRPLMLGNQGDFVHLCFLLPPLEDSCFDIQLM